MTTITVIFSPPRLLRAIDYRPTGVNEPSTNSGQWRISNEKRRTREENRRRSASQGRTSFYDDAMRPSLPSSTANDRTGTCPRPLRDMSPTTPGH
ncbi:MAG: hypothetical protein LBG30_08130, partial [Odoribacteraceae bacterium]|nr:hypothetical protein [Odoribacteraceae bacterium]